MPIAFSCPQCGKRYNVKDEMAGKMAKCVCGNPIRVPSQPEAPANTPSLFDGLAGFENPTSSSPGLGNPYATSGIPLSKPQAVSSKKPTREERAANLRRNLRRWWKIEAALTGAWFLLTVAVCIGMITYAHSNHLSEKRVQMLGQGCGTLMAILLAALWLTILLIADRKKSS